MPFEGPAGATHFMKCRFRMLTARERIALGAEHETLLAQNDEKGLYELYRGERFLGHVHLRIHRFFLHALLPKSRGTRHRCAAGAASPDLSRW